jgi:hypothetical protein
MLFKEVITVYIENHMEFINAFDPVKLTRTKIHHPDDGGSMHL